MTGRHACKCVSCQSRARRHKPSCICRYGAFVLAVEALGFTAVLPYALMLLRRCIACSDGLPPDDGRWKLPHGKRFVVRVLIPCYKVRGALNAWLSRCCCLLLLMHVDGCCTRWHHTASHTTCLPAALPCAHSCNTHVQESLGTIQATVLAALHAELPPSCRRLVYLCDDGADPAKQQFIASLGECAV